MTVQTVRVWCTLVVSVAWVSLAPPRISGPVETLGGILFSLDQQFAQWIIEHILRLPAHAPETAGGDPLGPFALMLGLLLLSILIAGAFELAGRRSSSDELLPPWLRTVVRFSVAATMLWYGMGKVFPAQFGPGVGLELLTQPVGQMPMMGMLWVSMGASRTYTVFAGGLEVVCGLLLLTRRTATAGAILTIAAMANVLVLDIGYQVPVKHVVVTLLILATILSAPAVPRLWGAMFSTGPLPGVASQPLLADKRRDLAARMIGAVVAVVLIASATRDALTHVAMQEEGTRVAFRGVWIVEPPAPAVGDAADWTSLTFAMTDRVVARLVNQSKVYLVPAIDTVARTIRLTKNGSQPGGRALVFAYDAPDSLHLVLWSTGASEAAVTVHLRRMEPKEFRVLASATGWTW